MHLVGVLLWSTHLLAHTRFLLALGCLASETEQGDSMRPRVFVLRSGETGRQSPGFGPRRHWSPSVGQSLDA